MTEMEIPQAARKAYRKLWAGLMAVKPQLDTPYPDDPRWTPWTRFVEPRLTDLSDALSDSQLADLEPTLTASEVKVLTETVRQVAYALGRKDAGEALDVLKQLVAVVDGPRNESYAVRCAVMWHAARDLASQAAEATSDATSGVPGHQEVSEAVRSPQEPCGHPTCPCTSQEAR